MSAPGRSSGSGGQSGREPPSWRNCTRSSLTQRNITVPVPDDVSYFKNCHLPDEADQSWQPQYRRIMQESEKVDSNQGTGTGLMSEAQAQASHDQHAA